MALVHLHHARLDRGLPEMARLEALLSPAERAQAGRYRFERDRRRFIVRRGILREVLAARVGGTPEQLTFAESAFGKPAVTGWQGHFSLSHSGEHMLLAVAPVPVGCDIEAHQADLEWEELSARLFAAEEQAALAALPPPAARAAFFRCWARKEAFVKALGLGLSYPLDAFAVAVEADARLTRGGDDWAISAVDRLDGGADRLAGAVVARHDGTPLALATIS